MRYNCVVIQKGSHYLPAGWPCIHCVAQVFTIQLKPALNSWEFFCFRLLNPSDTEDKPWQIHLRKWTAGLTITRFQGKARKSSVELLCVMHKEHQTLSGAPVVSSHDTPCCVSKCICAFILDFPVFFSFSPKFTLQT